jgi:arylsulfatase A-like enzyme
MMPEVLGSLGYESHLVGKWHLGYYTPKHLPAARGFASSFGYLGGSEDYFAHTQTCKVSNGTQLTALDLCSTHPTGDDSASITPEPEYEGIYSTNMLVDRATNVIGQHAAQSNGAPLFLYMSFQSVHGPCEVPDAYKDKYPADMDKGRRTFSGMVSALDEAVANLTSALDQHQMLEDSLIIFTTDNGGNLKQNGNNWPLRGAKFSLWEGGTRGYSFVYSASKDLIPKSMRGATVSNLTHAVDWFATILDASGNLDVLPASAVDSKSMWPLLTGTAEAGSAREQLVHGAYGKKGNLTSGKLRSGQYNYYFGNPGLDDWTRVKPEEPDTGVGDTVCTSELGCLFNVATDPNERTDLAQQMPELAMQLRGVLEEAMNDCPDDCDPDEETDFSPTWECESFEKYGCFGPMYELDNAALV